MLDITPSDGVPNYVLTRHDEIVIAAVSHRVMSTTPAGFLLQRLDGTGCAVELRRDDLARRIAAGQLSVNREKFQPEEARRRAEAPVEMLATLSERELDSIAVRNAIVEAALELRRSGDLKMTDYSIKENMLAIRALAEQIYSGRIGEKRAYAGAGQMPALTCSPRTLRTWIRAANACGVAGLADRRSLSGRRPSSLGSETEALLAEGVRLYATRNQPSKRQVANDIQRLFETHNETLVEAGRLPLVTPSRSRIMKAINELSPFHAELGRHGVDAARKVFAPVGPGMQVTRPLERVEIDEWRIDLMTILEKAGLWHRLTRKERDALGLEKTRVRYWLTVAIDVRTRCILAMRLSRNPASSVAVEAVEMALRDKGVFADAIGALSPWDMHGTPELVVTDCGSAFKSMRFKAALSDLGIRLEHTPGGMPHLRGTVERIFRTIGSELLPRLHGYTFSSLSKRGAHDPEKQAALSREELCFALVRWVVDIYHRTGHAGLQGETPLAAWRRLTGELGVLPPPDMSSRRIVFGKKLERVTSREGIVVMGVQYHSETLARSFVRNPHATVKLRWYAQDIGVIAVRLDRVWVEVPATDTRFSGVRAQTWLDTVAALRASARREEALSRDIVFTTLADIDAMNAEAAARAGLVAEDWSSERIAREEERLFVGFSLTDAKIEAAAAKAPGQWGEILPTGAAAEAASDAAPVGGNTVSNNDGAPDAHDRPHSAPLAPQGDADGEIGFEDK